MKLIGHLNAVAASRQVLEEYLPLNTPTSFEIIQAIKDEYSFQNFPNADPGVPLSPRMGFAGGKFNKADEPFGILALVMEQNGDIVQAITTDQADLVLDDLARLLDERFGFRVRSSTRRRAYTSNLVVEFDAAIDKSLDKISRIGTSINRMTEGVKQVALTRLAFGETRTTPPVDQVSMVEAADFLIERRVSQPMAENRYYCSAPLKTADHIRLLEEIEKIFDE